MGEKPAGVTLRETVRPSDMAGVRAVLSGGGLFHDYELDVAVELVQEALARGTASGYHFLLADGAAGELLAYACWGPIACTQGSFDLYWIGVAQAQRGRGLGRWLLAQAEARIQAAGGRRVYIETSGRPLYAATRAFYERCGYRRAAELPDFYAPGDAKIIYDKRLAPGP